MLKKLMVLFCTTSINQWIQLNPTVSKEAKKEERKKNS